VAIQATFARHAHYLREFSKANVIFLQRKGLANVYILASIMSWQNFHFEVGGLDVIPVIRLRQAQELIDEESTKTQLKGLNVFTDDVMNQFV